MTNKKRKLVLLTSIMTAFAVAAVALFSSGSLSSPLKVGGSTELVEGSITWNATNSEKTVHGSKNRVSYLRRTARGTNIYAYSFGQWDASDAYIFDSKSSNYQKLGIFISSEAGTSENLFQFQNITSINITTAAGSEVGATFKVYTDDISEGTAVYTGTASAEEETFSISTEVAGAKYLAIRPGNTQEIKIKSVSVNYECEPGGVEPTGDTYYISYYAVDYNWEMTSMDGIQSSSLVTNAKAGAQVEFTPLAETGYVYYAAFGAENIDFYTEGAISFTMPSSNVEICIIVDTTLESISISGQTIQFNVGSSFVFGGTVTAHYANSTSRDVTASASFTGYNMNVEGEYTVTVSYTENDIERTTTYSISVEEGSSQEVVITGTYNYVSRSNHSTPDWSLYSMTITFYSDKTCMWRNVRTNTLGNEFDCKVYFTYVATDTGSNITLAMALTNYDFTKDGEYNNDAKSFSGGSYDRPVNASFTSASARNDSGVLSQDKKTLTICTYDQSHSYEVYDTFTFTLAQ